MSVSSKRPLSPHLTIYRWQVTMVGSILHRATGAALSGGAVLLVAWLWAAAYNAKLYQCIHTCMSAWYGQVLLMGWALAFYYHLLNGIRHLWWDTGRGLLVPQAVRSGWTVIICSVLLTAFTWGIIYMART